MLIPGKPRTGSGARPVPFSLLMNDLDFSRLEYEPVKEPVYIIGPRLPMVGGISVHVERRAAMLRRNRQRHAVICRSHMRRVEFVRWLLRVVFSPRKAVYELNELYFAQIIPLCLRPFPKHIILRVHGVESIRNLHGWRARVFRWFLRHVDTCTLDGPHMPGVFTAAGYDLPANTVVGHAFIPPDEAEEAEAWATYGDGIHDFLSERGPLLLVYASQVEFCNGTEVYGLDLAVEAVAALRKTFPNIGLVIGLPRKEEGAYLETLRERIKQYGIEENVCFKRGQQPLWPLFRRVDLYLRPTNTDGDAVAVREARYLGCAVLASDVCPRPPGVHLFKNRDAADLARMATEILMNTQARTDLDHRRGAEINMAEVIR